MRFNLPNAQGVCEALRHSAQRLLANAPAFRPSIPARCLAPHNRSDGKQLARTTDYIVTRLPLFLFVIITI